MAHECHFVTLQNGQQVCKVCHTLKRSTWEQPKLPARLTDGYEPEPPPRSYERAPNAVRKTNPTKMTHAQRYRLAYLKNKERLAQKRIEQQRKSLYDGNPPA